MNDYKFAVFTVRGISTTDMKPLHPISNNKHLYELRIDDNEMSRIDDKIIDKINKRLAKDIHTRILSMSSFKSILPNKAEIAIARDTKYKSPTITDGRLEIQYETIDGVYTGTLYKGGVINIDVAVCYKAYGDCIELYNYSFVNANFDKSSEFVFASDPVFPDWLEPDMKRYNISIDEVNKFVETL